MKFTRVERYGAIDITARKVKLMQNKPHRQHAKMVKKMPLLASLLPSPESVQVDVPAEIRQRQARADASEQRMRALYSRVWRESRRDYFEADAACRAFIRQSWDAWTGPRTCMYYRYIVDLGTGVDDQRREKFRLEQQALRLQRKTEFEAQASLL